MNMEDPDSRLGKRVLYKVTGHFGTLVAIEYFEETDIEYWKVLIDGGITVEAPSRNFILDERSRRKPLK